MGADGGIRITKVSDIKEKWSSIKNNIINRLDYYINNSNYSYTNFYEKLQDNIKLLPDDLSDKTNEEVCKMLQLFENCDCPYLLNDHIITGQGDNVADFMNMLSYALPGKYIETWT